MGTFATLLRALLEEAGLSQAALARRIGISAQAVSGWFAAGNTPSRDNVERIEHELDVQPRGSLLTAAGYAVERHDTPTLESLIRSDPGLSAEDKRTFLHLLRMARARFAEETAAYPVDLSDPDEARLWAQDQFSEGQRWRWILELRAGRAGDADVGAQ